LLNVGAICPALSTDVQHLAAVRAGDPRPVAIDAVDSPSLLAAPFKGRWMNVAPLLSRPPWTVSAKPLRCEMIATSPFPSS
jgi:hypothetical protein